MSGNRLPGETDEEYFAREKQNFRYRLEYLRDNVLPKIESKNYENYKDKGRFRKTPRQLVEEGFKLLEKRNLTISDFQTDAQKAQDMALRLEDLYQKAYDKANAEYVVALQAYEEEKKSTKRILRNFVTFFFTFEQTLDIELPDWKSEISKIERFTTGIKENNRLVTREKTQLLRSTIKKLIRDLETRYYNRDTFDYRRDEFDSIKQHNYDEIEDQEVLSTLVDRIKNLDKDIEAELDRRAEQESLEEQRLLEQEQEKLLEQQRLEEERIRIARQLQEKRIADRQSKAFELLGQLEDSSVFRAELAALNDLDSIDDLIRRVEEAIRVQKEAREIAEALERQRSEMEAARKEAAEYHEMTDDWKDVWTLWQSRRLWCINDAHEYTEEQNLGQWRCWQHAGVWSEGRWTCCGRTYARDNGCVAADHRPFAARYTDHQTVHNVPIYILKKLGPRPGISKQSIVRYDKAEFERRAKVDFDVRTTYHPSLHFNEPQYATFYQPELMTVKSQDQRLFWDPNRKVPVYSAPEKRFLHTDGRYIVAKVVKREVFTDSIGRKTVSARLNPTDPLEPISLDHLQRA